MPQIAGRQVALTDPWVDTKVLALSPTVSYTQPRFCAYLPLSLDLRLGKRMLTRSELMKKTVTPQSGANKSNYNILQDN